MASITITLDKQKAHDLLTNLAATDDTFRENLKNNPSAALQEFGITLDEVPTPLELPPRHLATWALEPDELYHSPALIPSNPTQLGTCILWGITLVAGKIAKDA